ncbi:MAG TPA: dihydrofolate reductase family protein [Gaiellales bacterium]|jgi:dihydrofolate reductase|nr:dihydrofolate reductase family protein [Gaiellales bacterium]
MPKLKLNISMSLDGYIAAPGATLEDPLGVGGMRLHEWIVGLKSWREEHGLEGGESSSPDDEIAAEITRGIGAVVMGRKMFSGGEGPWESDPNAQAWWGDDPPFHVPVYVLSHHEREPLVKQGGTTFTFVTGGIGSALEQARATAGDQDISLAGGASVAQQYLAAGLLDELQVHVVPVLLGGGVRLFGGTVPAPVELEAERVVASPAVTHLRFRVTR